MHELNAEARRGAVTETLHGVAVEDPYRALEEDSPETQAWIQAQTERTERALARYDDPARDARIETLLSIGTIAGVQIGGTGTFGAQRIFYTKREGDAEQPVLYVRQGEATRPLIDPSQRGEHAAMDWYYASPGGRYLAFGISDAGDERSVLHVLDVDSGADSSDPIERTKWTSLSWLHDETGFYYTRYPAPTEPGHDAEHPDTYFPRVYFHRLGQPSASDPWSSAPRMARTSPAGTWARTIATSCSRPSAAGPRATCASSIAARIPAHAWPRPTPTTRCATSSWAKTT